MNELDCVRNIIYEVVQFQKLLLHEKMNRDVGDTQQYYSMIRTDYTGSFGLIIRFQFTTQSKIE